MKTSHFVSTNVVIAIMITLSVTSTIAQKPLCKVNSICFALDQSPSISLSEYTQIEEFTIRVSREIARRNTKTIFSAYGFSYSSTLIQRSTTELEREFIPALVKSSPIDEYTNIFAGVEACFKELHSHSGNRVIVVLTDGEENRGRPSASLVPDIRASGVSLLSIAVGDGPDVRNLRRLASDPSFFVQTSFGNLPADAQVVVKKICKVVRVSRKKPSSCWSAFKRCEFGFMGVHGIPTFGTNGSADKAFTPRIVSKNRNEAAGGLNSNGIIPQFISSSGSAINISLFGTQPFSPTAFKPITINKTHFSGVAHETWHGDQALVVRGRCVRVYFTHYQLYSRRHSLSVVGNRNGHGSENKCVVFRTA